MKIKSFDTTREAEQALLKCIVKDILFALHRHGEARILFSGGSTPKALYEQLAQENMPWEKIKIGLVDERWVSKSDPSSNEAMLERSLNPLQKSDFQLIGMVFDLEDENRNIEIANQENALFLERIDILLLGMGGDGHTASLFPNDLVSEQLLANEAEGIFATRAPQEPSKRITFSKKSLFRSENNYLLLMGEEKRSVLLSAKEQNLPISAFFELPNGLNIFYSK